MQLLDRKLARQTPVYDHADQLFFRQTANGRHDLMLRDGIDVIGTTTRIKALRFRGPDPAGQPAERARIRKTTTRPAPQGRELLQSRRLLDYRQGSGLSTVTPFVAY